MIESWLSKLTRRKDKKECTDGISSELKEVVQKHSETFQSFIKSGNGSCSDADDLCNDTEESDKKERSER